MNENIKSYIYLLEKLNDIAKENNVCATNIPFPMNIILLDKMIYQISKKLEESGFGKAINEPKIDIKTIGPNGEISIEPNIETSVLYQLLKNS